MKNNELIKLNHIIKTFGKSKKRKRRRLRTRRAHSRKKRWSDVKGTEKRREGKKRKPRTETEPEWRRQ